MSATNPPPQSDKPPSSPASTGQAKAEPAVKAWKPLGAVRDYFAVQLEQDSTWDNYRPMP